MKGQAHTKKTLQIVYLIKDFYVEYIENSQNCGYKKKGNSVFKLG